MKGGAGRQVWLRQQPRGNSGLLPWQGRAATSVAWLIGSRLAATNTSCTTRVVLTGVPVALLNADFVILGPIRC